VGQLAQVFAFEGRFHPDRFMKDLEGEGAIMDRRNFVKAVGLGSASAMWGCRSSISVSSDTFAFAHITDTHIQPELRAAEGCQQCFGLVNRLKPDFAIMGGDLVFDVAETGRLRADLVYGLYRDTAAMLEMPVYNVIGNHDVFGFAATGAGVADDPLFGKRMYEDRIGERFYTFDHKGWRFIALDSIGISPPGTEYIGVVDEQQLDWLRSQLDAAGPDTPVVVVSHIPVLTAFIAYASGTTVAPPRSVVVTNGKELVELFSQHNVKAVLQGHTHVRETIEYKGCKYITSGAVCGNWWRGVRMGHPEGFGLLTVRGDEIEWDYRTYGWDAAGPVEPSEVA
jgi:3',5'-cyclic AMP phosphodiesterase CpdA